MITYATLRDARAEINVQSDTDTSGDDYVTAALRFASRRIEALCGMDFAPTSETRYQDAKGMAVDGDDLWLDDPLMAVTSVTDGESNSLTEDTDFYVWPYRGVIARLSMLDESSYAWSNYDSEWRKAISIDGVWGYHNDYANAWVSTGDTVQDDPLAAGAATITVSDADGTDAYGRTRFSPGQLLKIESEYVTVLAVDTDANTLTVLRGQRGTTAAEHAQTTAISVWEPEPVIQRATLLWASYMFSRRGNFEETKFDGMAMVSFPPDAPKPVMNILREAGLLVAIRRPLV